MTGAIILTAVFATAAVVGYAAIWSPRARRRLISRKAEMILEQLESGGQLDVRREYRITVTPVAVTEVMKLQKAIGGVAISEYGEARIPWSDVDLFHATEWHAFVGNRKAGLMILPQTAFPDAAGFERFLAAMRQYRSASTALA